MSPKFFICSIIAIFFLIIYSSVSCNYNPHRQGEWLYNTHCASCHIEDGSGLRELIPGLKQSPWLTPSAIHSVSCIIRYGIKRPDPFDSTIMIYPMPPLYDLTDIEITNILNYIGNHFGNTAGYINPIKLKEVLSDCPNAEERKW